MTNFNNLYNKFFIKIASIPHDKLLHYLFGMFITIIVSPFIKELAILKYLSFIPATIVAFVKEGFDYKVNGVWSTADALATIIGALTVTLYSILLLL